MSEVQSMAKIERIMVKAQERSEKILLEAGNACVAIVQGIADVGQRNRVREWFTSRFVVPVPEVSLEAQS